eukprot:5233014-Amphidinium_carterae.1
MPQNGQVRDPCGRQPTQLRPNKNKSASEVNNAMVVDQLRCAGVIEAIKACHSNKRRNVEHPTRRTKRFVRACGR